MDIDKEYLAEQFKLNSKIDREFLAEQFKTNRKEDKEYLAEQFKLNREVDRKYLASQFEANRKVDKEYFEKQFKLSNDNITALDKRLEIVESKVDVLGVKIDHKTEELKGYTREAFEVQQVYLDARFAELMEEMKVEKRLDNHETWMRAVGSKVGVKFYNRT